MRSGCLRRSVERIAREEGLDVLGWRDTPVRMADAIGRQARATQPYIEQIFIAKPQDMTQDSWNASST